MSEKTNSDASEPESTWIRETLEKAVKKITSRGIVFGDMVEARPVWSLPYSVMIGQVRETREQTEFFWIISGEVPTDFVGSAVAATPREAARHFSMKWQLDAARFGDPATRTTLGLNENESWAQLSEILVAKSEELFKIVEDESLWREAGDRDCK